MSKAKNYLSLAQQLDLLSWLNKRSPFVDITYEAIAKEAEKELEIPFTGSNIRTVMEAAGMEIEHTSKDEVDIRTVVELLHGVYQAMALDTPPALTRLLRKYRL